MQPLLMRKPAFLFLLFCLALALPSCSKEARKARFLEKGGRYFKNGQYDEAKIEYLNVLGLDPKTALAYDRLGQIWLEEGAPLRAAPFLIKSKELAPDDLENRVRLSRVLNAVGHRSEAVEEAFYVLQKTPGNADAIRAAAEAAQTPQERQRVDEQLRKFPNQDSASFQLTLALFASRKGDTETARSAAERALKADPKLPAAHLFMASYWLSRKDINQARREFKAAADLAPPRSMERINYARFCAQSGSPDEAVNILSAITKQAPDYLPAWNVWAELDVARKDYDGAARLLQNVLNRDSENIDANVLQAKVWLAKGEKDRATDAFERLNKKYPGAPGLKLELARCYIVKNNLSQATTVLNEALATNPGYVDAALLLAQLNLKSGNAEAVMESMRALLAKHPRLRPARLLLADAYQKLGRLDDSATLFRDEIKESPQNADPYLALGVVLRLQNKTAEAHQALERAQELAPQNPVVALQLVDLDISTRDFDGALRQAQRQIADKPDSALAHFLEGKVYAAEGKWDLAEASLNKALSLNADFPGAYGMLATVYLAANKLPQAAQEVEKLVTKSPRNVQALMTLGNIYEKMRDFSKARDAYERLLSITPDFAPALNNLAFLYAEHLKQPDKAYPLAQKARSLQPGDGSIADTLGWVLYKRGEYRQALALFQESAAKSPDEPEIQYHLGMAHYMMGQSDAARTAFAQAAKSTTDFPEKREMERRQRLLTQESKAQLSLDELKALVADEPNDMLAQMRLGQAYDEQHAFSEAAAAYQAVVKLNPQFLPALLKLAELYAGPLNSSSKALEYAKRARDIASSNPQVLALLGRVAGQTGNFSWAYGLLEQSVRNLPDDPQVIHDFGWAAFGVGKIEEARKQMSRVKEIAPASPEAADATSFLAMMDLEQAPEQPGEGSKQLEHILSANPSYLPAQLAHAAVERAHGDLNSAATIYQQILDRLPDFVPAQKRLAALDVQEGRNLPQAYELATKARKSLPHDAELLRLLAEISYGRKEYSRVIELLKETAEKEPLDAKHLYLLGMSSLETNDSVEARKALDQALATGLKDPMAADARKALQRLEHN